MMNEKTCDHLVDRSEIFKKRHLLLLGANKKITMNNNFGQNNRLMWVRDGWTTL